MRNRFLLLACVLVIAMGSVAVPAPDGIIAVIVVGILAAIAIFIFRKFTEEKEFITTVFLVALAARMAFGILLHVFDLREFFGGDARAYDMYGAVLMETWMGHSVQADGLAYQFDARSGAGWGMYYFTGAVYSILGRNIFAAQSVCAVIGAATAPMVYFCANKIFSNLKVARFAAISIAIFPSFVIWSGQLLKDGLIIFLLVLIMTMILQLQERVNYFAIAVLVFSLYGVSSLRFYILYMVLVAIVGSFIIGVNSSNKSILRRTFILVVLGLAATYFGVGKNAGVELTVFGNLDRIQSSRSDLARAASSGYGEDVDVSTTEGALSALPVGFAYLMFAPFPWQATNLRQAITIPEVFAWWAMMPLLISGLLYAIKYRLRSAFPVLIFSLMLTMAYSLFLGNVGTAYRQRTQIQVFLFILIGVGWTVYKEKKENKRLISTAAKKRVEQQLQANARPKFSYDAEAGDQKDIHTTNEDKTDE